MFELGVWGHEDETRAWRGSRRQAGSTSSCGANAAAVWSTAGAAAPPPREVSCIFISNHRGGPTGVRAPEPAGGGGQQQRSSHRNAG